MKIVKAAWEVYVQIIYLISIRGHADKKGRIYSCHSAKMNHERVYFMTVGAFLPSLPFVLGIKEASLLFGFQYWLLLGFLVFFAFSVAIGVGIQKLAGDAPIDKKLSNQNRNARTQQREGHLAPFAIWALLMFAFIVVVFAWTHAPGAYKELTFRAHGSKSCGADTAYQLDSAK